MIIKTLALHSLTCLVGITSSLAVPQLISPSGTAAGFQSDTRTEVAIVTRQFVNRTVKSDRLPANQAGSEANGKRHPVQVPANTAPNREWKTDCKPPIDVIGRCFADLGETHGTFRT
ncbi:hypothetical protein [Bradyrhizobium barranii]|uniref:Uncharacterized protein n=1 Tax=Bradyrhizobium barranii subsp. barranii TaxID=2823807 RepID=A0A939M2L2_9BRAD|nr:hypothetical protein [Bradyrhizobium barranii]UEM14928.1 hypothetical protein J4G43_012215 [Bradyrhizobium barranii subsp. barranii]